MIEDSPRRARSATASAWTAELSRRAAPIVAIAVLLTLPLILPPVLPLTDLGGHIGRYAVQLDGGRDAQLAQWYTFRWLLIPNLGADLLVQGLAPLIGLEPAVRVIAMVAVFLQTLGILAVSRAVHGRITPFALLALPFVYAHSLLYGFLNYTLALGLLWCSLALWITMSKEGTIRRRWAVFAVLAPIMWTCHLVGWALLCIGAGSQELMRQNGRKGALLPAVIASIAPLTCLLTPWIVKLLIFQASTGAGKTSGFFGMDAKFNKLFQAFRDQWYRFDIISIELILVVILWSFVTSWTRLNRGLTLAALITTVCVIVVPDKLLGSHFADQRLIEPALLFALLAIGFSGRGPAKLPQILFLAATVLAVVRLAGDTVSLWQLGTRSAEKLKVLDALPWHAQMVSFRARRCPPPVEWTIDRWTHLSGYAIARRHAFSNDQWDVPGAQLLKVHNPAAGKFEVDDSQIVYEKDCLGQAGVLSRVGQVPAAIPYLWVLWSGQPKALTGWEPISSHDGSVLYRRIAVR